MKNNEILIVFIVGVVAVILVVAGLNKTIDMIENHIEKNKKSNPEYIAKQKRTEREKKPYQLIGKVAPNISGYDISGKKNKFR